MSACEKSVKPPAAESHIAYALTPRIASKPIRDLQVCENRRLAICDEQVPSHDSKKNRLHTESHIENRKNFQSKIACNTIHASHIASNLNRKSKISNHKSNFARCPIASDVARRRKKSPGRSRRRTRPQRQNQSQPEGEVTLRTYPPSAGR